MIHVALLKLKRYFSLDDKIDLCLLRYLNLLYTIVYIVVYLFILLLLLYIILAFDCSQIEIWLAIILLYTS